jgi:thioredoxin reductase
LPGVLTAGGASTLAKLQGVAPGHRVLVAGSGPFLLAAADDLSALGCRVEIVEATPLAASARGLATIAADPPIAGQTIGLLARLAWRRVRWHHGRLMTRIHGRDRVEAATIQRVDEHWNLIPGSERTIEVDGVCLGFGFVPQLELAQALGCALDYDPIAATHVVAVDAGMRTSEPGVYAAGEATGVGGMRVAMAEGRLAGLTAACDAGAITADDYEAQIATVTAGLKSVRRVADWLRRAYAPRRGLWALSDADTLLCRCEGVTRAEAEAALENNPPTPYAIKTATRAGMGLCQGRICGPYLAEWLQAQHGYEIPPTVRPWRIRPPLRPVPLGAWLASEAES